MLELVLSFVDSAHPVVVTAIKLLGGTLEHSLQLKVIMYVISSTLIQNKWPMRFVIRLYPSSGRFSHH